MLWELPRREEGYLIQTVGWIGVGILSEEVTSKLRPDK